MPNGIDLSSSVENEFFCLRLTAALGLPSAQVDIADFGEKRALVIERFDRLWTRDKRLLRRPQEDCCQALSVPPTRKYQSEGGPGIGDIVKLLGASDRPGADQLARVAAAYRSWAVAHPGRYRLMFSSAWGVGRNSPHIAHADRAMSTVVTAVVAARQRTASTAPSASVPRLEAPIPSSLAEQLRAWAERTGLPPVAPDVLWQAVVTWTRLHGIVSLEIEGAWEAMGLQPALMIGPETMPRAGDADPR